MAPGDPNGIIKVNDQYQKVVGTILGLSTGSLVLPVLLLKDFLSVSKAQPLITYLNWKIYCSWTALAISIFLAIGYYYLSAKWIKQAFGQPLKYGWMSNKLEKLLDWCFWMVALFFIVGLTCFLAFATGRIP
jgi:hypothetical protein